MNTHDGSASIARAQTPSTLEQVLRFLADCKAALAELFAAVVRLISEHRAACVARARREEPFADELTDDQVWRYLC